MRRYDDLIIDAPFWPDPLLEVDQTPFPKAAVSALAGFGNLGDEIQMIEGLGAADPQTCSVVSGITAMVAVLGPAACNVINNAGDKALCQSLVATGGAGIGTTIMSGMGCDSSSSPTPTPAPTPAPAPAPAPPPPASTKSGDNMILIGGGLAIAAALAFIAFGR
jgi:hypothetical protein